MATIGIYKDRIRSLKQQYDRLALGKENLLKLIAEAELSEAVYNSNSISSFNLSLKQTDQVIVDGILPKKTNLKDILETKSLGVILDYVNKHPGQLDKGLILFLHQQLFLQTKDSLAGKFRQPGEYIKVDIYDTPPPDILEHEISSILVKYSSDLEGYFLDKIALFHLEFERVHPFLEGNGRVGRALINFQLQKLGMPPIIIREKQKKDYFNSFKIYQTTKKTKLLEHVLALCLMESLHKRIAYLEGKNRIALAEYAKQVNRPLNALLNAAKRQTIPAFRERGVWKI